MNYDDDAGDRLIRLLADRNVGRRANLAAAARTADKELRDIVTF
jgi:hypothetical protein